MGTDPRPVLAFLDRVPTWAQVGGLYTLLAVVFTWPLIAAPWSTTPGEYFDIWGCLWTGDWFRRSLVDPDLQMFRSEVTGYPFGIPIRQLDSWIWAALSIPLTAVLGTVAGLNAFVLGCLVFSGAALYLLVRRAGVSHGSSLVAGSLLLSSACASALFSEGAVYLLMTGWIPLCALFLLDALDGRGRLAWLWGGLCLAAAGYTSGYIGVCAAIVCLALALASPQRLWRPRVMARLAAFVAVATVALTPLMAANRAVMSGESIAMDRFVVESDGSTRRENSDWLANVPRDASTLRSLVVPPGFNRSESPTPRERTSYLGFLPLALGIFGMIWLPWAARLRWGALLAVALVLMFGPVLQWDHPPFGQPVPREPALPMAWIYHWLPGAQVFRFPYRFLILALLALAVPVGLGLDRIGARLRTPLRWAVAAVVLAEVLLVAGGPVGKPVHRLGATPWYEGIRDAGGGGAVLEVGNENLRWKARRLFGQTVHRRPVADEFPVYVSLPTAGLARALVAQRIAHAEGIGTRQLSPERFRALLDDLHYDWIVHHHGSFAEDDALPDAERRRWTETATEVLRADFGAGEEYEAGVTVYRVVEELHGGPKILDPPTGNQRDRMLNGHVVSVFESLMTGEGERLTPEQRCPECEDVEPNP